jgi:hypothetical protein
LASASAADSSLVLPPSLAAVVATAAQNHARFETEVAPNSLVDAMLYAADQAGLWEMDSGGCDDNIDTIAGLFRDHCALEAKVCEDLTRLSARAIVQTLLKGHVILLPGANVDTIGVVVDLGDMLAGADSVSGVSSPPAGCGYGWLVVVGTIFKVGERDVEEEAVLAAAAASRPRHRPASVGKLSRDRLISPIEAADAAPPLAHTPQTLSVRKLDSSRLLFEARTGEIAPNPHRVSKVGKLARRRSAAFQPPPPVAPKKRVSQPLPAVVDTAPGPDFDSDEDPIFDDDISKGKGDDGWKEGGCLGVAVDSSLTAEEQAELDEWKASLGLASESQVGDGSGSVGGGEADRKKVPPPVLARKKKAPPPVARKGKPHTIGKLDMTKFLNSGGGGSDYVSGNGDGGGLARSKPTPRVVGKLNLAKFLHSDGDSGESDKTSITAKSSTTRRSVGKLNVPPHFVDTPRDADSAGPKPKAKERSAAAAKLAARVTVPVWEQAVEGEDHRPKLETKGRSAAAAKLAGRVSKPVWEQAAQERQKQSETEQRPQKRRSAAAAKLAGRNSLHTAPASPLGSAAGSDASSTPEGVGSGSGSCTNDNTDYDDAPPQEVNGRGEDGKERAGWERRALERAGKATSQLEQLRRLKAVRKRSSIGGGWKTGSQEGIVTYSHEPLDAAAEGMLLLLWDPLARVLRLATRAEILGANGTVSVASNVCGRAIVVGGPRG